VASDREFVAFVCEQLRGAGEISSKRMFGQAAVYLGACLSIPRGPDRDGFAFNRGGADEVW
jgi:hypothetical protein